MGSATLGAMRPINAMRKLIRLPLSRRGLCAWAGPPQCWWASRACSPCPSSTSRATRTSRWRRRCTPPCTASAGAWLPPGSYSPASPETAVSSWATACASATRAYLLSARTRKVLSCTTASFFSGRMQIRHLPLLHAHVEHFADSSCWRLEGQSDGDMASRGCLLALR